MTKRNEIICAIDLEYNSFAAESVAYKLAKKLNAVLTIFHVDMSLRQIHDYYSLGGLTVPPGLGESLREKINLEKQKKLERRVHAIGGANDENVQIKCGFGHPSGEILKYINETENKVSLMVISKRKRSFFSEFFFGSVAQQLIEEVRCPTLIVPDSDDIFLSWDLKNILVATSLVSESDQVVKHATHLAREFGSQTTLLHVVPENEGTANLTQITNLSEAEKKELSIIFDSQEEIVHRLLEEEKKNMALGSSVEICTRKGSAATKVLETAEEVNADLIVVGAHSKNNRVSLGSVAATLARSSRVPLLVVRHD